MNVLVTGGNGFIGSHLCERLAVLGHGVRALLRPGRDPGALAAAGVEIVRGDVTGGDDLAEAVRDTECVVHCAAALKGLREADLFQVNVEGTRRLVEACRAHAPGLRRFVLVSSLAAAGPSPGGLVPRTEDTPDRPLTWYGRSKLAAESLAREHLAELLAIVRPPIVFGPRERDVLGYFRIARRGLLPVLRGDARHYSLVVVTDLVDGLVRAAEAPEAAGQTYYMSAPEVVTWRDLGRRIADALGVHARVVPLPSWAAVAAGFAADRAAHLRGRPDIFSSQKVIEMRQPAWVCSPEKAARELGWRAATPLDAALAETARWYRVHGWL